MRRPPWAGFPLAGAPVGGPAGVAGAIVAGLLACSKPGPGLGMVQHLLLGGRIALGVGKAHKAKRFRYVL
jgi:hypothetical protein